ncbi:hypothetical protein ASPWEDRAFT_171423 [Aspergillus wentii DTO 134E9]|uniref:Uncharacterized protein n=1 Tax=Aspergillus wentii DTO 134E9 TaxID=1073089 RepID=A0A1L9RSP3_ASPWE|nr:uncharacterized protein ASPWEDRAFT_171423 [Aspergillus wentii DTO 134E9]OJJ37971.1 hypothetical protein ASPWEDRAFT_171423 [Aspergillus wentii DTO 134E9]
MPPGAPPPTANPSEVRAYLLWVLTNYHSFTKTTARNLPTAGHVAVAGTCIVLKQPTIRSFAWRNRMYLYVLPPIGRAVADGFDMWAISVSLASTFAIHGFCLAPALELGATIRRICLAIALLTCYVFARKERNAEYWFPVWAIGLVAGFVLTLVST